MSGGASEAPPPVGGPSPRSVALILSIITAHALLGPFIPGLPSWKMFSSASRFRYELRDARGELIDLPSRCYIDSSMIMANILHDTARDLARREPERAPLTGILDLGLDAPRRLILTVHATGEVTWQASPKPAPAGTPAPSKPASR